VGYPYFSRLILLCPQRVNLAHPDTNHHTHPAVMFRKISSEKLNNHFAQTQSSAADCVQHDWEQRDYTQAIQLGVTQLTAFLNEFDGTTRGRLALLNSKLARVERRMTLVEATLRSVDQED